jgi:hypothetical protein
MHSDGATAIVTHYMPLLNLVFDAQLLQAGRQRR